MTARSARDRPFTAARRAVSLVVLVGCSAASVSLGPGSEKAAGSSPYEATARVVSGDGQHRDSYGSFAGGIDATTRSLIVRHLVMTADRSSSFAKTGILNPLFNPLLPIDAANPRIQYFDVEWLEATSEPPCEQTNDLAGQPSCRLITAKLNINAPTFLAQTPLPPSTDARWTALKRDRWHDGTAEMVPWWPSAESSPHGFGEGIKPFASLLKVIPTNLNAPPPEGPGNVFAVPGDRDNGMYRSLAALNRAVALFDARDFDGLRALMTTVACDESASTVTDPDRCGWPQSAYANNSTQRCNSCHAAVPGVAALGLAPNPAGGRPLLHDGTVLGECAIVVYRGPDPRTQGAYDVVSGSIEPRPPPAPSRLGTEPYDGLVAARVREAQGVLPMKPATILERPIAYITGSGTAGLAGFIIGGNRPRVPLEGAADLARQPWTVAGVGDTGYDWTEKTFKPKGP
jgi:hypothetical protein